MAQLLAPGVKTFKLRYIPPMHIRPERQSDHAAITEVTTQAFASVEHSDHTEAGIISRLRETGDLTLSLVAIDGDDLIGHVAFSPVTINGQHQAWYGLGPVSARPDRQRQAVGSALIQAGLQRLRSLNAAGCVVLGDPDFYSRFGFERDDRLHYAGAPPEYFMCLMLEAQDVPLGRIEYAPAFTG